MITEENQWLEEKFKFIRIPKVLLDMVKSGKISPEGLLLYGLMLDRANLSRINGKRWRNKEQKVYIIFTLSEICKCLHCGHDKATRVLHELRDAKLISLKRSDYRKPYEIVVQPFRVRDSSNQNAEKPSPEPDIPEFSICGNPAVNKTDGIDTDVLTPYLEDPVTARLAEILEVVRDGKVPAVRIYNQDVDITIVQERYSILDDYSIRYVLGKIKASAAPEELTDACLFNLLWDAAMKHSFEIPGISSDGGVLP